MTAHTFNTNLIINLLSIPVNRFYRAALHTYITIPALFPVDLLCGFKEINNLNQYFIVSLLPLL